MQIGLLPLLGVLLIGLKLTGHIAWSWWLVLLPIYITPVIFLIMFLIVLIIVVKEGEQ